MEFRQGDLELIIQLSLNVEYEYHIMMTTYLSNDSKLFWGAAIETPVRVSP